MDNECLGRQTETESLIERRPGTLCYLRVNVGNFGCSVQENAGVKGRADAMPPAIGTFVSW